MTLEARGRDTKIAYMMSRFPKLTETFVLDEMLEMQRQGVAVEVFPLWRERAQVIHPDALPLVARAHFLPLLNLEILRDLIYWLVRSPRKLLQALATLIRENCRSVRFLAGSLVIFPKACTMAKRMEIAGVSHIHAHFASHPAAAALVIGRLTGLTWSFTAHGSDLHREQAMLGQKVREASFVVTISDYNRRFILDRLGSQQESKIRVVHCGVDADSFKIQPVHSAALEIVCIGTLHEVKGQRYLLEACAKLTTRGVQWHCHLIGDGPDREQLIALVGKLGIPDRVTFHGACDREQVRRLLAGMNLACAPSVPTSDGRREGIPVALIEAAACGLPLVASRLSGIPELVLDNQTGMLTEPGDSEDIARVLEILARDPSTRKRLGEAAAANVRENFSLQVSVTTLRRLIRDRCVTCPE
ncbi:MAG: glycosyltransferase family 4 protein [Pseudomonadales bacterium]